jgi:hypothetical protein
MGKALRIIDDQDLVRLVKLLRTLTSTVVDNPFTVNFSDENSVQVKPTDRFYVRHFQIHEMRKDFEDWALQRSLGHQRNEISSATDFVGQFEDAELQFYGITCRKILNLSESDIERWAQEFCRGSDVALKAILMALLPELRSITLIQNSSYRVRPISGPRRSHTVNFLDLSLRRLSSTPGSQWPCFQSVREVNVGARDQIYARGFYYHIKDVASLLHLPSLITLRLNNVSDQYEDYAWEWQPRISSCENLTINPAREMSIDSMSGLLRGIKHIKKLV